MANVFVCSNCGGDVTRCDCHKKRVERYTSTWQRQTVAERIAELDDIVKHNLAKLRRMIKK